MSIRDIDRVNGRVIRKLVSPTGDKSFGYLSGRPIDSLGNLTDVEKHATLTEARVFCGAPAVARNPFKETAPKSSYAQNRKGYKADSNSGKKGK